MAKRKKLQLSPLSQEKERIGRAFLEDRKRRKSGEGSILNRPHFPPPEEIEFAKWRKRKYVRAFIRTTVEPKERRALIEQIEVLLWRAEALDNLAIHLAEQNKALNGELTGEILADAVEMRKNRAKALTLQARRVKVQRDDADTVRLAYRWLAREIRGKSVRHIFLDALVQKVLAEAKNKGLPVRAPGTVKHYLARLEDDDI